MIDNRMRKVFLSSCFMVVEHVVCVILEPKKNEVCQCFHCFPIYLP